MTDTPKRTGYRLTYDAQMYYDDWKEYGGCRCFLGNAPCSSCTHEGHPISLEENDEAWELDEEEDMSRSCITDKGSGMQPPKPQFKAGDKVRIVGNGNNHKQPLGKIVTLCEIHDRSMVSAEFASLGKPWGIEESYNTTLREQDIELVVEPAKKDFIVGKWYKCINHSCDVTENFWYRLINFGMNEGSLRLVLEHRNGCGVMRDIYATLFDINSESDYDPNTAQPAGYTAYVVFKQESTGFGRNTHNGKEYAYKCSHEDYTQYREYRAFDEDVFAEVNVSGVEKKVKVLRIEAKVDPKATKSIVRILPKELAKDVEGSKLGTPKAILEAVNFVHDFKPNDFSITKEDVNMSTTQRKVVEVQLFDDAKGLPVQDSLVAKFDNVLTEDDNDTTIREVIMNNDLKATLKAHNAKRAKVINLDILERTGNSVPLQPVLLKDLRWKVIG